MRYCITLFHGSVYAHTAILDHILCAGNNCVHVHDYVSIYIIIRSKFRYGTRGIGFVFNWSCWNGIKCIKFGDNKVKYFIFLIKKSNRRST